MSRRPRSPDQIDARHRADDIRNRTRLDLIGEGLDERTAAEFGRRAAAGFIEGASFAAGRAHRAAAWSMACLAAEGREIHLEQTERAAPPDEAAA